ncbi:hypothetical protein C8Q79DRAFT_960936 [Trametes meyenii]|nr:hypothetical protein C8Q79DRAFT_960936 [Trametes meyenii]
MGGYIRTAESVLSRRSPPTSHYITGTMPLPHLPQELIDEIIDTVASCRRDPYVLSACTLVCSSWTPRARSHLLSTVTLMEPSTVTAFMNTILYSSPIMLNHEPLPLMKDIIQHLRLGTPMVLKEKRERQGYGFAFFTINDIITSKLPNLKTLSIAEFPDFPFYRASLRSLREDFRSVKNLHLHRGIIVPETLACLLAGFPQLSSLRLTYDGIPRDRLGIRLFGSHVPRGEHLPPSLTELHLGVPDVPLVEWLVDGEGLRYNQLRSLSLLFQPLDDLRALKSMLQHCGGAVRDLSIGYGDPPYILPLGLEKRHRIEFVYSIADVFIRSPLAENKVLRSLRIEGCESFEHTQPVRQDAHSWIPVVLKQIRSEAIEEITFVFRRLRRTDSPMLSWMSWNAIDGLFQISPLCRVRRITIEIEESEVPRSEVFKRVAVSLPIVTRRRDLLRVECFHELTERECDRNPPLEPRFMSVLDWVEEELSPITSLVETSSYPEEWDSASDYYSEGLTESGI